MIDVVITDYLPLDYIEVVDLGGGTLNGNELQWKFSDIGPYAGGSVTFTARVKDDAPGGTNIHNSVFMSAKNADPDSDSADTLVEGEVVITGCTENCGSGGSDEPELTIIKSVIATTLNQSNNQQVILRIQLNL